MATLSVKVDSMLVERAERVFTSAGLDFSSAVNLFLKQAIETNSVGLAFSESETVSVPGQNRTGKQRGCCSRVRGMLSDCPDMSVDNFLARKHADKELDL